MTKKLKARLCRRHGKPWCAPCIGSLQEGLFVFPSNYSGYCCRCTYVIHVNDEVAYDPDKFGFVCVSCVRGIK